MHDYVWFIAPIDYHVELSLVDKTFCNNCSHFILKWFQPNSLGALFFLEESLKKCKNSNFEGPLFQIREYAFNLRWRP